ncbi:hypothetical protein ACOME3_008505 [Neoechinorhynchus agilis]
MEQKVLRSATQNTEDYLDDEFSFVIRGKRLLSNRIERKFWHILRENRRLRRQKKKIASQLVVCRDVCRRSMKEATLKEQKICRFERQVYEMQKDKSDLHERVNECDKLNLDFIKNVIFLKERISVLEAKVQFLDNEKLERLSIINACDREISELTNRLQDLSCANAELMEEIARHRRRSEENKILQMRLISLEKKIGDISADYEQLHQVIEHAKSIAAKYKRFKVESEFRISELKIDMMELKYRNSSLGTKLKVLYEMNSMLKSQKVTNVRQNSSRGIGIQCVSNGQSKVKCSTRGPPLKRKQLRISDAASRDNSTARAKTTKRKHSQTDGTNRMSSNTSMECSIKPPPISHRKSISSWANFSSNLACNSNNQQRNMVKIGKQLDRIAWEIKEVSNKRTTGR